MTKERQPLMPSYPRELAASIATAGFMTVLLLESFKAIGPRDNSIPILDVPESALDQICDAMVKILRFGPKGETELLPLASGFIIGTVWHKTHHEVFVISRRSNLGSSQIAICYYPYQRRETSFGNKNVFPAEILCEDATRDLVLLHGMARDHSFSCRALKLADDESVSPIPYPVYCSGFVKKLNWSGEWYGKETDHPTRAVAVHDPAHTPASGLPQAELIEFSDYAPIDRRGVFSGAPVVDYAGLVVGVWMDRQPYSRFALTAREIRTFLETHGFDLSDVSSWADGLAVEIPGPD